MFHKFTINFNRASFKNSIFQLSKNIANFVVETIWNETLVRKNILYSCIHRGKKTSRKGTVSSCDDLSYGRLKIYRLGRQWLLVFRYPIPYFENRFVTEARCSLLGNAAATHAVCISTRPHSAVPSLLSSRGARTSLIVSLLPFCTYLIPSSGIFHVGWMREGGGRRRRGVSDVDRARSNAEKSALWRVDFNCVSRRNRLLPGNSSNDGSLDGSLDGSRAIGRQIVTISLIDRVIVILQTRIFFNSIDTLRKIDYLKSVNK